MYSVATSIEPYIYIDTNRLNSVNFDVKWFLNV